MTPDEILKDIDPKAHERFHSQYPIAQKLVEELFKKWIADGNDIDVLVSVMFSKFTTHMEMLQKTGGVPDA